MENVIYVEIKNYEDMAQLYLALAYDPNYNSETLAYFHKFVLSYRIQLREDIKTRYARITKHGITIENKAPGNVYVSVGDWELLKAVSE